MKKAFVFMLILAMAFVLPACGASAKQEAALAPAATPATAQAQEPVSTPDPTPVPEPEPLVKIEGNTITVKDDGTGESSNQNGMQKTVVLTNRNIGYAGTCGTFKYEVQGIQIAKIKASGDAATMMGIEPDQEAVLVAIQMAAENTSSEDMNWNPYMSTIVTSSKEQVSSNWLLSDQVGGEFLGNVVKQGQIYFICKNTNADDLNHIQWRIEAPYNKNFENAGDEVTIEINLTK